jgi:hypothetical protein
VLGVVNLVKNVPFQPAAKFNRFSNTPIENFQIFEVIHQEE